MKTITRSYRIICPSCNGKGYVPNPENGFTTVVTIPCPACNGQKTQIVNETTTES